MYKGVGGKGENNEITGFGGCTDSPEEVHRYRKALRAVVMLITPPHNEDAHVHLPLTLNRQNNQTTKSHTPNTARVLFFSI